MSKRIAFTEENCTNCHLCSMYCSLVFSEQGKYEYRPAISRIRVCESDDHRTYAAHVCLQCDEPACMDACPVGAITKDPKTGIVEIDSWQCTGCESCVDACEYDCVFLVEDVAVKCEVCDDPLCVKACAAHALTLVDDDQVDEQGALYKEVRI